MAPTAANMILVALSLSLLEERPTLAWVVLHGFSADDIDIAWSRGTDASAMKSICHRLFPQQRPVRCTETMCRGAWCRDCREMVRARIPRLSSALSGHAPTKRKP